MRQVMLGMVLIGIAEAEAIGGTSKGQQVTVRLYGMRRSRSLQMSSFTMSSSAVGKSCTTKSKRRCDASSRQQMKS